ncbi:hypothetical protein [Paenibacillus elgii]|uniref:hypothetical protein n=1 Tax=Paenibacillus elgii TaxID=189691 RepID=UPI000248C842|nr:hypothetical protein [Paenibacillus elgii]
MDELLSPFDKWCDKYEVNNQAQLEIINLCGLFILLLSDDFPGTLEEKEKMTLNFKRDFVSDEQQHIEPTLETFQLFLTNIQQKHSSVEWNAKELIRAMAASGRAVDLKEKLLA